MSHLGAKNAAYLCDGLDPGRPVHDSCRNIEKSWTKYLNKSSLKDSNEIILNSGTRNGL